MSDVKAHIREFEKAQRSARFGVQMTLELHIRVEPGGHSIAADLIKYGEQHGIVVKILEFP